MAIRWEKLTVKSQQAMEQARAGALARKAGGMKSIFVTPGR
jgi:hypothetical protein